MLHDSSEMVHRGFVDFLSSISAIQEDSDRIHYISGIEFPTCNGVIEKNSYQDLTLEEIDRTVEHFQYKNLPFVWWSSASILEKKGFFFGGVMKGMALDLSQGVKPFACTSHLEIRKTETDEELMHFSRLLIEAMGLQPHTLPQFYSVNKAAMVAGTQIHYLGYIQGAPVSALSLALHSSYAGLWNGVTLPEYRRKGILTSLMHHALLESERRKLFNVMALLQPKGMARGPVEKLGFSDVCDLPFYIYGSQSIE